MVFEHTLKYVKTHLDYVEKLWIGYATGVENYYCLPETQKEFLEKVTVNTPLSGFNLYMQCFMRYIDYQ